MDVLVRCIVCGRRFRPT